MSKLVTIFGGSGFVGRYIARRLAKEGWRIKVAVRRPNEALFVKPYGAVGQVQPVFCNIRDDASVRDALQGADAVVNCVGILAEDGKNTFAATQADGAARIARLAKAQGIERFVQMSAIGADVTSQSEYSVTKAKGEAAVLEHIPNAMILRPSVIFGAEDQFFNRFAAMTKLSPFLPLIGSDTRFQPVYVDDVAKAAVAGVMGTAQGGIYELGGPDVASFRDLMSQMLDIVKRSSIIVNVPFFAGRMMALGFDTLQTVSLGLLKNAVVTRDQIKNLAKDNVVSGQYLGFEDLGIEPSSLEAILPEYLWRYRPSGQYSDIKDSAKKLN